MNSSSHTLWGCPLRVPFQGNLQSLFKAVLWIFLRLFVGALSRPFSSDFGNCLQVFGVMFFSVFFSSIFKILIFSNPSMYRFFKCHLSYALSVTLDGVHWGAPEMPAFTRPCSLTRRWNLSSEVSVDLGTVKKASPSPLFLPLFWGLLGPSCVAPAHARIKVR